MLLEFSGELKIVKKQIYIHSNMVWAVELSFWINSLLLYNLSTRVHKIQLYYTEAHAAVLVAICANDAGKPFATQPEHFVFLDTSTNFT